MLWLYGSDRLVSSAVPEYDSLIVTSRLSAHATLSARLPGDYFDAVDAAVYATVDAGTEIFLVENYRLTSDADTGERYVELSECRSATALLHTRTVDGTEAFSADTPGQIVSDLIGTLTGGRAITGLAFGTGTAEGDAVSMQTSWGDMGATVFELLASQSLGLRSRLSGTTIYLDVYSGTTVAQPYGEAWGNASGAVVKSDTSAWANYAIVLGEGEGAARVRVDVDATGSDPLIELYVDAKDIKRVVDGVELSLADYQALLTQRGYEKLAAARKVLYAEADVAVKLNCGDTIHYDSGLWSADLVVTQVDEIQESGITRYLSTLGQAEITSTERASVSGAGQIAEATAIVPGIVLPFAGAAAPAGWLMCDGSAVSRTTYAALFAAIGVAYGAGDTSTTFNVPDLRGRVPVGKSTDTEFNALGNTGGAKTHALSAAELAAHAHLYSLEATAGLGSAPYNACAGTGTLYADYATTKVAGSGTAHNNLQPFGVVNYIVKY